MNNTYLVIKRFFDVVASTIALIVMLPLEIIIALIIKCEDGGPVLYAHSRVGMKGDTITVHKFRSMKIDADDINSLLPDEVIAKFTEEYKLENDPRVTRIGRFIRKTSIDEIPQFYDVIGGNLSIVGSRPVVKDELKYYSEEEQSMLLSKKPGITGYWQVMGRNNAPYSNGERQSLELYYAKNAGIALDIKILFKTVTAIISTPGK